MGKGGGKKKAVVKNRSNDNPKDLHGAAGAHAMGRGGVCTRKLAVIPLVDRERRGERRRTQSERGPRREKLWVNQSHRDGDHGN